MGALDEKRHRQCEGINESMMVTVEKPMDPTIAEKFNTYRPAYRR
jgi:hypothetical protein